MTPAVQVNELRDRGHRGGHRMPAAPVGIAYCQAPKIAPISVKPTST